MFVNTNIFSTTIAIPYNLAIFLGISDDGLLNKKEYSIFKTCHEIWKTIKLLELNTRLHNTGITIKHTYLIQCPPTDKDMSHLTLRYWYSVVYLPSVSMDGRALNPAREKTFQCNAHKVLNK